MFYKQLYRYNDNNKRRDTAGGYQTRAWGNERYRAPPPSTREENAVNGSLTMCDTSNDFTIH